MSTHIALARKWRPQRFDDVIGQRGTVLTLKNAIASGRLAQSFIFAGPRGVGKTTTARILARALNCVKGPTPEPCGKCDACIEIAQGRDVDVLEIDGATYTGVDAVREVIVEPLGIAPMRDRFKVFIIDEVHRISKNAFDALLKSIEEPPPYVKFMMATTELDKVPDTIRSRSQVYELKTLPLGAIRDQLRDVTKAEKVAIDDGALTLVARSAEGSMRDALSALDQILAFTADKVTAADVSTVLGLIGRDRQFAIVETVAEEDVAGAFDHAAAVVEAGYDLRLVCRELARLTRDLMVVAIDPARLSDPEIAAEDERDRLKALADRFSREDMMRAFDLLSRAELDIRSSSQPRHAFEMALAKWIHLRKLTPLADLIGQMEGPGSTAVVGRSGFRSGEPAKVQSSKFEVQSSKGNPGTHGTPRTPEPSNPGTPEPRHRGTTTGSGSDIKASVLSTIRETDKTLYGMVIAQAQKIEVEGDALVFTFAPAHRSLMSQLERKKGWIEQLAASAGGRRMAVVTREAAPAPVPATVIDPTNQRKAELRARAKNEPSVQAMLDVFGGEIEDVEEIQ
jgi:DNA polymerase-3 subunit gamma/tau